VTLPTLTYAAQACMTPRSNPFQSLTSHQYTAVGLYTVSLTVTTAAGSDTETKTGYISVEDTPTADFTASPNPAEANASVEFTDTSDKGAQGNITSWAWTFGDGGTSTDQNPTHAYATAGLYTVSLTVTKASGATDTETKTDYITIQGTLLPDLIVTIDTGPPESAQAGDTIQITYTVENDSTIATVNGWTDAVYLSHADEPSAEDKPVATASAGPLAAGATYTQTLTIPTMPDVAPGQYALILQIDVENAIAESDEANLQAFPVTAIDPVMSHE